MGLDKLERQKIFREKNNANVNIFKLLAKGITFLLKKKNDNKR